MWVPSSILGDGSKNMDKEELKKELEKLETEMVSADFWSNKDKAQTTIKRIQELKAEIEGVGKYDSGDAVMTIFSGAGGDDAEDFSSILLNMYLKYCDKNNFQVAVLHQNENDHGGYRNITIEISGKGAYGILKNESGVHRLVRISPFNAKSLRHTSFSMVEVIPKFEKSTKLSDLDIPDTDIKVELSRSSGPGGQNVNKRETAVRVVHIPTNLSAQSDNERSQAQNKEKAMQILYGKIYKALEEERISKEKGMYISKTTQIEWGNQIRSYVMHPYKMVKDHRTGVETSNIERVLDGDIGEFLVAEKEL
ncbi:MAG: Peptide chain release factor 2 [Parcubacteria group bacterium GW2011_GWF2_40_69]|nr:MAG: Peptide chain release factor 2 [Parcubacteria group bacterium GW2011_GWC1_39_12]KKR19297.1 MAG: Peptide chain release factor 2 [Parcubacteria group bacterium GW2011_GWF1_39_37]KKR35320.1 MAG: Peptide chain release factor 2 [Parcubacteria group bacterium GW2011_GWC2_40_10]KKR52248.1 MAG: Peptide chain release factor 2 [Parcubacteria group bacterium GW2011_GWE1_40_20]KKR65004.1 MAG: Peptide chain release factor 2 [Parcubacteria group bacterium GW2011_GWB1_40_5]KKR69290.1 MAG: Peptide cha